MKDYTLSEILSGNVDVLKTDTKQNYALWQIQRAVRDFDIEPRDMIELPCKIPLTIYHQQLKEIPITTSWEVLYRDIEKSKNAVFVKLFYNEGSADEFLASLKKN